MTARVIRIGIYDRAIVARLMREAERLKCRPEQLALALISCGIEMPDAVLDGAEPAAMHPHAVPRVGGLTGKQRDLLTLILSRAGSDGLTQLAEVTAAEAVGLKGRGPIGQRFKALVTHGCIEVVRKGWRGGPSVYRVTERGRAMVGGGAA